MPIEPAIEGLSPIPRLHLPVGLPKTATTTIQNFLFKNKKELARHDVLYPLAGRQFIAHYPFENFFRPTPLDWINKRNPDLVKKGCLRKCGNIFQISMFFLLRRNRWIQAKFRENKKNRGVTSDRDPFMENRLNWFDYQKMLSQWAGVFGIENINVAAFDKGDGRLSVERMFLDAIGIGFSDDMVVSGNCNARHSQDCLAYL